jgi:hypothetical protein
MFVVFRREPRQSGDELEQPPTWSVRYCVASATFKTRYFERVSGVVSPEVVAVVTQPGRDIANGHKSEITVRSSSEHQELGFTAEFFSNTYSILCLLTGG